MRSGAPWATISEPLHKCPICSRLQLLLDYSGVGYSEIGMSVEEIRQAWLGIDFSGNHDMWRPSRRSNIYIAEVHIQQGRPLLSTLQTVQELPGEEEPFRRLVSLLKARDFNTAAIDAPFSVPCKCLPSGGHRALLERVAGIERPKSWPFPSAQDFVCRILAGRPLLSKKPLRKSELAWSEKGINVRSTLWAGPRGGAAMTAACLTLLHQSQCPIWPWDRASERGLLVEAFPAAQLCHWGMEFEGYNGDSPQALSKRENLVASVSKLIEIPDGSHRKRMEQSADALDAVLCAFAAVAVSTGKLAQPRVPPDAPDEGQIAVHERIEGQAC